MITDARIYGYDSAKSLTTSDSAIQPAQTNKALMVQVAGNVSITFFNDITIVFTLAAYTVYPFCFKRINATSTTATGIIGLGWV